MPYSQVAELNVRTMVDLGIIPAGSFSFTTGSLLDGLQEQAPYDGMPFGQFMRIHQIT